MRTHTDAAMRRGIGLWLSPRLCYGLVISEAGWLSTIHLTESLRRWP